MRPFWTTGAKPRGRTMPKFRTGFVFEENGKWYARFDYLDEQGNRRRVRRTEPPYTKTAAKELLKKLISDFDEKGSKTYAAEIKTFKELAVFFEQRYLI